MRVQPFFAEKTLYYAHAISDGVQMVLGAEPGDAWLAEVFREAGFTRFRRAFETPFNRILKTRRWSAFKQGRNTQR